MITLGLNYGSFHDASAAIAKNGEILMAVAEERLSRRKHDGNFPKLAVEACLKHAGMTVQDLDDVVFGWPAPASIRRTDLKNLLLCRTPSSAVDVIRQQTIGRITDFQLCGERIFERTFGRPRKAFKRIGHHYAHALSAFAVSGFPEAAVLVIDGRGAWEATSIWKGEGTDLKLIEVFAWPNSLGLFYAEFTNYLGFERYQDEWKVMGLAPYGRPGIDLSTFMSVGPDSYQVNAWSLLSHRKPGVPSGLEEQLGKGRQPDEPLTDRHRDIAFAVQDACERAEMALVSRATAKTSSRNLCIAGGVGLNSKANGLIAASGRVDNLFVQPAAADDGVAIGAALATSFSAGIRSAEMKAAYLGPDHAQSSTEQQLRTFKQNFARLKNPSQAAAHLLSQGMLVGWFQGREEFGPRALGNRSILADPRDVQNRDKVNSAVKFREEWRPFAPSVLAEACPRYFEKFYRSPFMTLTFQVRPEYAHEIAAAVHIDGSARVQSVTREQNARYYDLIAAFGQLTGVPAVLNTSFNLKGEAIVSTVYDAVRTFHTSGLDALIADDFLVRKSGKNEPDFIASIDV